ncbi:MAG: four helix bundle protein [Candidatus Doudnabacteria bacterium]|nr:four helix bundle protein [Candidatus Doudnabacteria bacterium]
MPDKDLKIRTKSFTIRIVKLCRALPKNYEGSIIGNQLFRCGTSVGANYRAACRARSKLEFISKIGIVIEECDESIFWMELLIDLALLPFNKMESLLQEAHEILAIMIASSNSAKKNL